MLDGRHSRGILARTPRKNSPFCTLASFITSFLNTIPLLCNYTSLTSLESWFKALTRSLINLKALLNGLMQNGELYTLDRRRLDYQSYC